MTATPPGGPGDRTDRPHPRDNGLAAEHFVALIDVDPRIAVPLLDALRQAGIAAYVAPTPGRVGGYLDVQLPERPTDRLWVDGARRAQAGEVVRTELAEHPTDARPDVVGEQPTWGQSGDPASSAQDADPADAERGAGFGPSAAPDSDGIGEASSDGGVDPFDEIVAGFNAGWPAEADPPWPDAENLPDARPTLPPSRVVRFSLERAPQPEPAQPSAAEAYLDEHFVPEPPPPLPRPAVATFWALVGLLGGLGLLVLAGILQWQLDPVVQAAAGIGILGGFATLVWRMRDDSDDDEPDDGAVV